MGKRNRVTKKEVQTFFKQYKTGSELLAAIETAERGWVAIGRKKESMLETIGREVLLLVGLKHPYFWLGSYDLTTSKGSWGGPGDDVKLIDLAAEIWLGFGLLDHAVKCDGFVFGPYARLVALAQHPIQETFMRPPGEAKLTERLMKICNDTGQYFKYCVDGRVRLDVEAVPEEVVVNF